MNAQSIIRHTVAFPWEETVNLAYTKSDALESHNGLYIALAEMRPSGLVTDLLETKF